VEKEKGEKDNVEHESSPTPARGFVRAKIWEVAKNKQKKQLLKVGDHHPSLSRSPIQDRTGTPYNAILQAEDV
jgi:hypothetical protein